MNGRAFTVRRKKYECAKDVWAHLPEQTNIFYLKEDLNVYALQDELDRGFDLGSRTKSGVLWIFVCLMMVLCGFFSSEHASETLYIASITLGVILVVTGWALYTDRWRKWFPNHDSIIWFQFLH